MKTNKINISPIVPLWAIDVTLMCLAHIWPGLEIEKQAPRGPRASDDREAPQGDIREYVFLAFLNSPEYIFSFCLSSFSFAVSVALSRSISWAAVDLFWACFCSCSCMAFSAASFRCSSLDQRSCVCCVWSFKLLYLVFHSKSSFW